MTRSAGRAGASAYAALVEWENVGRLAALAPGLADRIAVAESSAGALARYRAALDRLIEADQEPAAAMAAGVRFVDAARARVEPATWWEALVAVVVWVPLIDVLGGAGEPVATEEPADEAAGGGEAAGAGLGAGSGGAGLGATQDLAERAGWAVWRVREAIEADSALGARLVLWGRRLGGEAIALAADFTTLDSAADFAGLADRVAKAHAAALVPLFGRQEQRPEQPGRSDRSERSERSGKR